MRRTKKHKKKKKKNNNNNNNNNNSNLQVFQQLSNEQSVVWDQKL
jgi:hypothetical protein